MKKQLIFIICILAMLPLFAVETIRDSGVLPMTGYVYSSVKLDVTIDGSVPFDLETPEVQENPNPTTVIQGLRIGSYNLKCNMPFKLYIAHDKLHLVARQFGTTYYDEEVLKNDPGTLSEINYRLYANAGVTTGFVSCLANDAPEYDGSDYDTHFSENRILITGNNLDLVTQGLYISLEDNSNGATTAQNVQSLKAGLYSSDIYFYFVVGE